MQLKLQDPADGKNPAGALEYRRKQGFQPLVRFVPLTRVLFRFRRLKIHLVGQQGHFGRLKKDNP